MKNRGKREPNAMIVVESTKKRIFRYVPPQYIPSSSFEKLHDKKWLHVLGLDSKGQFWPIECSGATEGRMPTDLYMAIHCADEVEEVYGISMPTLNKIQIGIIVGCIIASLIVLFLIVASFGGR